MQRLFASLLFCAVSSFAIAQSQDFTPEDTEAMRASAEKHVNQVDEVVGLDAEQRTKVMAAYMHVERELVAVNHRFDRSGFTEDERSREMNAQWIAMEKMLDFRLKETLTGTQYAKWAEVSK